MYSSSRNCYGKNLLCWESGKPTVLFLIQITCSRIRGCVKTCLTTWKRVLRSKVFFLSEHTCRPELQNCTRTCTTGTCKLRGEGKEVETSVCCTHCFFALKFIQRGCTHVCCTCGCTCTYYIMYMYCTYMYQRKCNMDIPLVSLAHSLIRVGCEARVFLVDTVVGEVHEPVWYRLCRCWIPRRVAYWRDEYILRQYFTQWHMYSAYLQVANRARPSLNT